jgi:hypothetical protein
MPPVTFHNMEEQTDKQMKKEICLLTKLYRKKFAGNQSPSKQWFIADIFAFIA